MDSLSKVEPVPTPIVLGCSITKAKRIPVVSWAFLLLYEAGKSPKFTMTRTEAYGLTGIFLLMVIQALHCCECTSKEACCLNRAPFVDRRGNSKLLDVVFVDGVLQSYPPDSQLLTWLRPIILPVSFWYDPL